MRIRNSLKRCIVTAIFFSAFILQPSSFVVAGSQARGGGTPPYKVYAALLTQAGTSAPTATVLQNTLGGTVVWTRVGAGDYRATLAGAFTVGKVPSSYGLTMQPSDYQNIYQCYQISTNAVALQTLDGQIGNPADVVLSDTFIEIRVYP